MTNNNLVVDPFPNNKVLVTGAAGWLGSRLVESLARGLREHKAFTASPSDRCIRCLVLPGQNVSALQTLSPHMEIVFCDIRNRGDCERFCQDAQGAILFHTAGIVHPRRVREFYEINRDGAIHLLDAAVRAGVKRFVAVSSNSPCGCNPHPDHLFDELSPYRPYRHYGRSKMEMELAVQQCAGKIETVIIRAPWFYGPNQPARQTLFFKMIRDGKVPVVGNGRNLRSMAYVDNLCQGL